MYNPFGMGLGGLSPMMANLNLGGEKQQPPSI